MGHYYSEMVSDDEVKERNKRWEREDMLTKKLAKKLGFKKRQELKEAIRILLDNHYNDK